MTMIVQCSVLRVLNSEVTDHNFVVNPNLIYGSVYLAPDLGTPIAIYKI